MDADAHPQVCAICLDDDVAGHEWCTTVCGHKFHVDCADKIRGPQRLCPLCRRVFKVVPKSEDIVLQEEAGHFFADLHPHQYSFSMIPTGSINFSRADTTTMRVFCANYNVMRICRGMAGVSFTS